MEKKRLNELIEREVYKDQRSLRMRLYNRYINPQTNAVYLYRRMAYLHSKGFVSKVRAVIINKKLIARYGILASPNAEIGKGLRFVHPTSIVIGANVVAGDNLTLYQNTTIGGARTGDVIKGNQPHLGNNITMFANSLVLGKVKVGDNVLIGANSLLLTSAPDNSICVGSPAVVRDNKGDN